MTLRDAGLALVRAVPFLEDLARRLYTSLPEIFHDTPAGRLQAFFASENEAAFVQIGAYDGVAGDPVRPREKFLVVELLPKNRFALKEFGRDTIAWRTLTALLAA